MHECVGAVEDVEGPHETIQRLAFGTSGPRPGSDLGLAARYAELIDDKALRRRVFDKITKEHTRTINAHKLITGQDNLLADNPALARSVFNRFPYLEPLNHLQVELLRRYRSGDDDELVQRGILLTMNGLASALRNSG